MRSKTKEARIERVLRRKTREKNDSSVRKVEIELQEWFMTNKLEQHLLFWAV